MSAHVPSAQPPVSAPPQTALPQRLHSPGIVDRHQPSPVRLTPQHIGGFSGERDQLPTWIRPLQTPSAQVEREIPRLEDALRLGLQHGLHRDEAAERGAQLGRAAGRGSLRGKKNSRRLVESDRGVQVPRVDRRDEPVNRVDRTLYHQSNLRNTPTTLPAILNSGSDGRTSIGSYASFSGSNRILSRRG